MGEMDEAEIPERLDDLLTHEGRLRGPGTLDALRLLDRREVELAFARVARAFDDGEDACEVDLAIVDRAHAARVAVAVRHGTAGRTEAERRVAERVDRRLAPHGLAVLHGEEGDLTGWLKDAWLDGAYVDEDSWWGFGLAPSWREAGEAVDRLLLTERARLAVETRPDRHEEAWTSHLLEHGHPSDGCFHVALDWRGVPRYGQWCRDWPDCVMDDLAEEWARVFERWGRDLDEPWVRP